MRPRILSEHHNYMSLQIKALAKNLDEHIQRTYGADRRDLSYMSALPDKIKNSITPELQEELDRLVTG